MTALSLPGRDRPYVAAPFLGILVTVPVQLLSGPLGLVPAQTVVVALIAAGLVGGVFGTRYADNTPTAASLTASLAAGGAVIVLIVAGSL
jgi:hypothetical protein